MSQLKVWTAAGALLLAAGMAQAGTIFVTDGSAVAVADRIATFDAVVTGTNLASYTEGGLNITLPNTAFVGYGGTFPSPGGVGFSGGFHYGVINNVPTRIAASDGALFSGIELNVGTGFGPAPVVVFLAWETRKAGVVVGSGVQTAVSGGQVGWADALGFDQLSIGSYFTLPGSTSVLSDGSVNAVAIDNVGAKLLGVAAVPTPSAAWMALGLLGGLGIATRLRRRSASTIV